MIQSLDDLESLILFLSRDNSPETDSKLFSHLECTLLTAACLKHWQLYHRLCAYTNGWFKV